MAANSSCSSLRKVASPPFPQSISIIASSNNTPFAPTSAPSQKIMQLLDHTSLPTKTLPSYLRQQLTTPRLDDICRHLWFAGRPDYVRPLHRQLQMQRKILVTEQPDLHLVWMDDLIHIKPLPAWLLCHDFFATHVCTQEENVTAAATGFLRSYLKLVRYPSDHRIALERGLLPHAITWETWSRFASAIALEDEGRPQDTRKVSPRYIYGELRLFRLNMIYRFWYGHLIGGYHLYHTNLSSFFCRNFTWPLVAFAYATTLLGAMQVILTSGRQGDAYGAAALRFALGVIIVIVGSLVGVFAFFLVLLVYNLTKALWRRSKTMGYRISDKESV